MTKASTMRISEAVARALHRNGAPTHRIEQAVCAVAAHQGRQAEVLATPTGITLDFDGSSRVLRLDPPGLHLGPLRDTWDIVNGFLADELDEATAVRLLCVPSRERYPMWMHVVATAMIVASGTVLVGGSWRDLAAGPIVGLLSWLLWSRSLASPRMAPLADVIAGFSAAVASGLLAPVGISPSVVTLASIFALLPGLSLVAAMSEVAAGSWTSGASRTVGAFATLARLAGGIMVGHALTAGIPTLAVPAMPTWTALPAVIMLGFAAMVQLGATYRDVLPGVVAGAVAYSVDQYVGGPTGTVLAATVGGLLASLWSWRTHVPAQSVNIAAILPLVPGSISLSGTVAMLSGDTDGLVTLAATAAGQGLCIVGGLLLASALAPEVAPGDPAAPTLTRTAARNSAA